MDWNQRYTYNFPTIVRFGAGVIDELGPYLKDLGLSKPLIVSDKFLSELPFFKNITKDLNAKGLTASVYTGVSKNPIKSDVLSGVKAFHESNCDSIVGLGGGASMDVARAIAMKAHHPDNDLFDFDDATGGDKFVVNEIPHFVTVPTTSGTGSEVGRSTVIADDETHRKRVLFSPRAMASRVFADPVLSMELPAHVTAATGMDALTHNIEAYLSKGFSPLCDGVAIEGIKLVSESLEKATLSPDLESRSKMMMSALMGATSFQKGLGIVHSLAHPLSTVFDTHHGLANAVMLPYGLEFNKEVSAERFKFLEKIIGCNDLIQWVNYLNKRLGMPASLKEMELDSSKIDELSDLALADVCHLCNPKEVTLENFKSIYNKAFS
ncbi:MAG: iron-containing alcohol dehydrogenase [Bacteriovoracaceae bacterium]|nr:iron-containing alcohol dehydrogenase [Bacteriovoracaceae bacterium]